MYKDSCIGEALYYQAPGFLSFFFFHKKQSVTLENMQQSLHSAC
uniref:Uncharacterized protein n=1 Tax=Anguilla anguilla TaxID=7936 RepID=A0A0E9TQV1_ANGAN